ncbi:hypothetical protein [Pseudidiomarina taiwanensis]|uniref:Type II/III secretion system secretin-like domain-containing protein n=1 Tax=Pseudidiomarina taiwanensis TaxID=337250 RepID=A0A432ZC96_9GAMM|nr:hypothetical protein [Pseudidiomarina taiwanensis]RUO75529.1 hypothetical protein CWI83_10385 [Pseudidiomarina taiwanensis]
MNVVSAVVGLWLLTITPNDHSAEILAGMAHTEKVEQIDDVIVTTPAIIDAEIIAGHLVVSGLQEGLGELVIIAGGNKTSRFYRVVTELNQRLITELEDISRSYPAVTWQAHQGLVVLRGELVEQEIAQLQERLGDYPEVLLQLQRKPEAIPQQLELSVQIAEVKSSFTEQLGLRWPNQVDGLLISTEASQAIQFVTDIQTQLDILEQEGHARLLAKPTLLTQDGGKAEFLVGGEIPLPQVSAQGMQDVSYRDYGIALEISPSLLADNIIQAQVYAEISSIDPATSVAGIPGILTRKVRSIVHAESNESLVLSGLLSQEQAQHAERFPWLHQLPILGKLFASEQFRQAQTELIVVVTPRIRSQQLEQPLNQIELFRQRNQCVGMLPLAESINPN